MRLYLNNIRTRYKGLDLSRKIEALRKELDALMNPLKASSNERQINELENIIEKLVMQEEMHWKQRARTNWLAQGLIDDNGQWVEAEKDIADVMLNFFANLFSSNHPSAAEIEEATKNISPLVDEAMNEILQEPYIESDIYKALFDMHPSKAPGPDGFTALFFQKNWSIVGREVVSACLYILNDRGELDGWNETNITLIPKVAAPGKPSDFRPISLCNTCYKVVARAITNRLRSILGKVINQNQSAFVPGRLITDNVIIGYECIHWIHNNKRNKTGFGALKLDMSKTYDRVEWKFLEAMMTKLGFASSFVALIMRCISSVVYSIRVNQALYGKIRPQRGIRQGDPLSPYLFTICAQGLSTILTQAEHVSLFQGVKIASNCPSISHLFFADDSLIFFRALDTECLHIKKCLQIYEKASGQLIAVVKGHELYLGLPTFSLRSKRIQFAGLRERLLKKINGWSSKLFSAGGKETLIKSVLQAIPSYAMSCFKLPVSLCLELEQCCSKFWWKSNSSGEGMHWIKWRNLCKPKQYRGMGFRSLLDFNRALLAKQVWRIICDPASLMAKILKARYFRHGDILTAQLGSKPSYIWRSILWSRGLIQKGVRWRVGNGLRIKAYSDNWITSLASGKSSMEGSNESPMVSELILPDRTWNVDKVRNLFPSFEADSILDLPLHNHNTDDIRYWKWGRDGQYSVKSGYLLEIGCFDPHESQSGSGIEWWWKFIWKLNIPQKVRIFLWRACNDLLPNEGNLFMRHILSSVCCGFCGNYTASTSHSLIFCPKVCGVWKETIFWSRLKGSKLLSFLYCGISVKDGYSMSEFEHFCMLAWASIPGSSQKAWDYSGIIFKGEIKVLGASSFRSSRLDVDAGFNEILGMCSAAAVIRNHRGIICAAAAECYRLSGTILDAEIRAINFGMTLALQSGFHRVWVFSDSLSAVQEVNFKKVGRDPHGVLVSNILENLKSGIFYGVSHIV
ncbi:uncharacterized protein LOC142542059 [Primulina tabacum]|uniref:uncharacterized protein LOC142542059 n=1 Tax=Primulina tabacum TaxID=48773 RepID=UPI003F5A1ED0